MKKQLALLSLVILSGSVSMAIDKVGGSLFDAGMMTVCPGVHGDPETTACSMIVITTGGVTFSPVLTVVVSGQLTTQMSHANFKLLVAAKEDASLFLSSETELRTVKLQAALNAFRHDNPTHSVSDIEISQFILAL